MARDNRLSRMLHVLIHIDQSERGMTSDQIGAMLGTNPVVVRRTMAGLRARGYVTSEKGHGGGWKLARPLEQLTLLDIYEAIGEPSMFALGLAEDHPQCLVVGAVNDTLNDTFNEARQLILKRFEGVTIGDVAAGVKKRRRPIQRSEKASNLHPGNR